MDNNKRRKEEMDHPQTERINLNDHNRDEEEDLRRRADEALSDLDRNLDEQFGGTGNTVTSKPNNI